MSMSENLDYENSIGERFLISKGVMGELCEMKILEVSEKAIKIDAGYEQWVLKEDFESEYKIVERLPEKPRRELFSVSRNSVRRRVI